MIGTRATRPGLLAVAAGILLGVAYTLSPLTVLMLPAIAWVTLWASRGLTPREQIWFRAMVAAAVAVRLLAIGGLFLSADDARPFTTFFGDEEMFKFRSVWLRNIGLGVPISAADFIYAVEETGKSYYLFLLAFIQALVGDAPYGIHVLNMALYFASVFVLYRVTRRAFGSLAAFGGAVTLLWLPSLFVWSISALKEPLYTLIAALELVAALAIATSATWQRRVLAVVGVVILGLLLESLRKGGLLVAGLGTAVGVTVGLIASRPRLLRPVLLAAPFVIIGLLAIDGVQARVMGILRSSALYHVGHVFTPGVSYRTLDAWYYIDPADIHAMPLGDAAAYVARALVAFVAQPLPWTISSPALLAYLPEHVFWLLLVALMPVGVVAGLRRDALLTCTLAAHGGVIVLMVALTSGNVGTLIRHRGLALPYFVWLAALGAVELLRHVRGASPVTHRDFAYANR
jgi:hypothetical protein